MKIFLSLLLFSIAFSTQSGKAQDKKTSGSNGDYVLLRSGEKIENITPKEWKYFYRKNEFKIEGRTIVCDSIDCFQDGNSFNYMLPSCFSVKRIIEGKISVFEESQLKNNSGTNYFDVTYYVKKGDDAIMPSSIERLKKLMADNAQAVNMLHALEQKVVKRLHGEQQVEIVKYYNAH